MQNISSKSGQRESRTRATYQASTKSREEAAGDTPTVRQRISEARRSGILDLRGMGLTQIPVDATKIHQLTALLLGNNKFTSIPVNIVQSFPSLAYLDFSNNRITSVPNTLAELEDLEILDLEGNPELPSQIPPAFGPLTEVGKLAFLLGDVSDLDAGSVSLSEESEEEEHEQPVKSDRYDTDDEEDYNHSDEEYHSDKDSQPQSLAQKRYKDFLDAPSTGDASSDRSARSTHSTIDFDSLDPEFRALMSRIVALDNDRIESSLRKRWSANDTVLAKYVAKRYGGEVRGQGRSSGKGRKSGVRARKGVVDATPDHSDHSFEEDDGEEGAEGEEAAGAHGRAASARKREKEAARRLKERHMKRQVHGGRKVKTTLLSRDDRDE
ncbi:hypothetical protein HK097_007936 [Rhizophlyctis rosea]|uniref:Uncharacterized protein n=1 Tax=Rhizophlyctis rosea TaxID=64517 RepID=A0AAD5X494_9FUNG|nr:hypothetical protein HK097_007936 [Rhizophlyctis rosea]